MINKYELLENIIEGLLGELEQYNYKNSPSEDSIKYYNKEYDYYRNNLK